jgi:hypothetical protein
MSSLSPIFKEEDEEETTLTTVLKECMGSSHALTLAPPASTPFLIDSLNVATCPYKE